MISKIPYPFECLRAGNIPEGWAYVLPTEAQWEYACRAGTTTAYSWGDSIIHLCQLTQAGCYETGMWAIRANPWGFFDMHGNVGNGTADWYDTYAGSQTRSVRYRQIGLLVSSGRFLGTRAGTSCVRPDRFDSDPGGYRNNSWLPSRFPAGLTKHRLI